MLRMLAGTTARVAAMSTIAVMVMGTAPAAANCPSPRQVLGQPDGLGLVVSDLAAARGQIENATEMAFQPPRTQRVTVTLDKKAKQTITLSSSAAEADQPMTELVHAEPSIGPWDVTPERAVPFLSYTVRDIGQAESLLRRAVVGEMPGHGRVSRPEVHFRRIASSDRFSFWKGPGGLLVRLVEAAAPGGAASDAPRPVALGLYPCDVNGLQTALAEGLGMTWHDPQAFTLTWTLADGEERPLVSVSTTTQEGRPFLTTESPHGFPGEEPCSSGYTPYYLVFVAQDVTQAEGQAAAAGMGLIAHVPGAIAAYRGNSGVALQFVAPSFVPPS